MFKQKNKKHLRTVNAQIWSVASPRVHKASKIDLSAPQGDYG